MIYALANQKGGVGKTTLTLLLGAELAHAGQRVLVVDCDPQASATHALGIDAREAMSVADVMLEPKRFALAEAIQPTSWGLDLAPSEIALARKEAQRTVADEHVLSRQLRAVSGYDVVLLDCPPSLGSLTVNALTAADRLVIVTEPGLLALQGMSDLLETVDVIQQDLNPALEVAGVIINLADRTSVAIDRVREVREFFGDAQVWEPVVPRWVIAREAIEEGRPLRELAKTARGRERHADDLVGVLERLAERMVSHVRA